MDNEAVRNLRKKIIEVSLRMAASGLVVAKEGNVSARIPGESGLIIITPTAVPYEKMQPDDLPIVDLNEKVLGGNCPPSVEIKMHLAVYRARPDAGAVIHTHSTYATAVASLRENLPPFLEEQTPHLGGEIKTAKYARSGTDLLGQYVVEALGDRQVALIANHGDLCCGKDLDITLAYALRIERIAQVYLIARGAGKIIPLPLETLQIQEKRFQEKKLKH